MHLFGTHARVTATHTGQNRVISHFPKGMIDRDRDVAQHIAAPLALHCLNAPFSTYQAEEVRVSSTKIAS